MIHLDRNMWIYMGTTIPVIVALLYWITIGGNEDETR